MKKIFSFIVFLLVLAGGLKLTVAMYLSKTVGLNETKIVMVPKGVSLTRMAKIFSDQGLIEYPRLFVKVGQLYGYSSSLKYGEYEIQPKDSYHDLLDKIVSGDTFKYNVTFPEGDHIYDYANNLQDSGLVGREIFLKLVKDRELIRELLGEEVDSLEGYLFPDTYSFSKADSPRMIVSTMVKKFKEVISRIQFGSTGMSRHELVTLASIVEKETGAAFERPVISSVFHNRLKKRMRLQTDPTIIYGIMHETGNEIQNIKKSDITKPTAYNTYVIKGLPPGPIGNPGAEALAAAANPKKTDFLYFVSQNDGTHIFTKSYKEHLRAVKKYQMDPNMRRGKSWRDLKNKKVQ